MYPYWKPPHYGNLSTTFGVFYPIWCLWWRGSTRQNFGGTRVPSRWFLFHLLPTPVTHFWEWRTLILKRAGTREKTGKGGKSFPLSIARTLHSSPSVPSRASCSFSSFPCLASLSWILQISLFCLNRREPVKKAAAFYGPLGMPRSFWRVDFDVCEWYFYLSAEFVHMVSNIDKNPEGPPQYLLATK